MREGFVILPLVGFAFAGSGKMKAEFDCNAGACDSNSLERGYDQNRNLLLGIDALYHVLPSLRVGLGLQWMPSVTVDVDDGDSSTELGTELAPLAVVEGVFGGKNAGAVRGFIGANFLFPGGEQQDLIDAMDAGCRSIVNEGGSCTVQSGPYTSLTLGAAAAYLRQVSKSAALRFELSLQYVSFSGPKLDVSEDAGADYEDSLGWSGTRLSFRFGVEL